jgi:hypothetical protein
MNRMDYRLKLDLGKTGEGIDTSIYFAESPLPKERPPVRLTEMRPTEREVEITL